MLIVCLCVWSKIEIGVSKKFWFIYKLENRKYVCIITIMIYRSFPIIYYYYVRNVKIIIFERWILLFELFTLK